MSLYIHPENQELLWKIVNKNPLIQSYFSSYPPNIRETWFKQTISSFYEQNRNNVTNSEQLYEINKNTLSYMIQDVKRNVEFMEQNRSQQPRTPQPTPTDLLKPYSVTENKEDRFTDQYQQYQKNYQSMFDKKVPESIDFREQFNDPPISGNMEDLVQRHLRERDEELKRYAPAPFFGQGLSTGPTSNGQGLNVGPTSNGQGLSTGPTSNGQGPTSNGQVNLDDRNRLKIDSTPENIQLAVEELPLNPPGNRRSTADGSKWSTIQQEKMLQQDNKSNDSTVKWLDNENSEKIQSLEQEITMLKGQVLQLTDKMSFLINTNKDIFDFSAQRLKMSNIKITGGFLYQENG